MKKNLLTKMGSIIGGNKLLRIPTILNVALICLFFIFLFANFSYKEKIVLNLDEVQKNEKTLEDLKRVADEKGDHRPETYIDVDEKAFAPFEEVIPFITFLENKFLPIDPTAEITVKSRDEQIPIDHYADYSVRLKINKQKDRFFVVVDELHYSNFITKVLNFKMQYETDHESKQNRLAKAELVIRLYLE